MMSKPIPVILLVEDSSDDEALTRRAMERCGITNTLIVARDGVEALQMLIGDSEGPHAPTLDALPAFVLLDLKLPKIDGLEVLRRLRASSRTHTLPIVVLTSSNEVADVEHAYALGANSYIRKPVDYEQFSNAINHISTYWLLVNHPVAS
jgi:two-component system response regulator